MRENRNEKRLRITQAEFPRSTPLRQGVLTWRRRSGSHTPALNPPGAFMPPRKGGFLWRMESMSGYMNKIIHMAFWIPYTWLAAGRIPLYFLFVMLVPS